jgi:hypothetical protein
MNKRGAGVVFLVTSAALYASRYIAAAIFGSNVSSWDAELFQAMLSYVGDALLAWSTLLALLGLFYLIWGEWDEWRARRD